MLPDPKWIVRMRKMAQLQEGLNSWAAEGYQVRYLFPPNHKSDHPEFFTIVLEHE